MGAYPSIAGGGVTLPIHVPAGGTLADSATDQSNVTIGAASPNVIQNLILRVGNIVQIGAAGTAWVAQGGAANLLLTSRQINQGADESAVVGAAGAAAALPATPKGYWIRKDSGGADVKVPYYN